MRHLSSDDLIDLASPTQLVAAIEQALRDYAENKVAVPVRQHLDFGDSTLLTMPAIGEHSFGVKVVSVTPSNAQRGMPVVQGLMTLGDRRTGALLATLDAAMLTAQRTGAVGAVGLKYTAPASVTRLGVIGIGVQGVWQTIFACSVRNIRSVHFLARSDEKAQRFVDAVSGRLPSVELHRCRDVDEVLARAEVIIAATTSSEPVVPPDRTVLAGKHFISVGSFKPSMQELPNALYELAGQVVIDSQAACEEVGDIINPAAAGVISANDVIHIADLVTQRRTIDVDRTTVFKSVGMALYDLYAAQVFVAAAQP